MPDLDAIRGREAFEALVDRLVDAVAAECADDFHADPVAEQRETKEARDALLAALATAEEERDRMAEHWRRESEGRCAAVHEADALKARADAAERRAERMLAAVVAASHTVIPDHGAEWMNGFAAGQRAMRAALARAEGEGL